MRLPSLPTGLHTDIPMQCLSWPQEGIYRLLLNSLSLDLAENPCEFVVYGNGKAVRDEAALRELLHRLTTLQEDETLLVQSGRPVGVFPTHQTAPRVLMSTAMLVPHWSNWHEFRVLEQKNLTLFGQSTAASWAYIGAQGILQATFETLWQVAKRHFHGTLNGRLVLTSGLGGMGCAQPLAVEMNGGVAIVVEADPDKVRRRLETNHIQAATEDLQLALQLAKEAMSTGQSRTIGLVGNAADVYEAMAHADVHPDIVTDQTSAHDLLGGYVPAGMSLAESRHLRVHNPQSYLAAARETVRRHAKAMLQMAAAGAVVFEYGNHLRGQAAQAGVPEATQLPSFVTLFARDLLCVGITPLRWVALSGDVGDIYLIDRWLLDHYREDERLTTWLQWAEERVHFQGLPARSAWLSREQQASLLEFLISGVREGVLRAPLAITRDHFAGATMASPHRETEGMPDGSDAIADWPVLNALLTVATGATLVSLQQGGGVGIGYSMHAGMTVVVDGSPASAKRARQTLLGELHLGVLRYAQAGYSAAQDTLTQWHGDEPS